MTQSDWGDWLPLAVESATPDGLALWYLGCNGFVLKASDGTILFIDPYLGTGDPPRTIRMIPVPFDPGDVPEAEAILATHEHTDHVHGPSQGPILAATGAAFVGPEPSIEVTYEEDWTEEWALDDGQFVTVREGDALSFGEVTVHVEPANDPDSAGPVSYVFEHGEAVVFHGGDTRPCEAFETIGERYDIDVGILAFGSAGMIPDKQTRVPKPTTWYNDENEIVEAAAALRLDRLLPTHWDMWKGLTADPTALRPHIRGFDHPRRLELVEIGDRVDV